jgi:hypothetical protein
MDHEHHRHFSDFSGFQFLRRETETVELAEILTCELRAIRRNRLAGHGDIGIVAYLEHHLHQLSRMHANAAVHRPELPRQLVAGVGVQFQYQRPTGVDLGIFDDVRLLEVVDAGDFTDLLVERHQREAETEHGDGDHEQLREGAAVIGDQATSIRLTMMPKKNRATTEIRTTSVFVVPPPRVSPCAFMPEAAPT